MIPRRSLIVLLSLISTGAGAGDLPLPKGWTNVSAQDLGHNCMKPPAMEPCMLAVEADFDGNGLKDQARFLKHAKRKKYALYVSMHYEKIAKHIVLEDFKNLDEMARYSINLAMPGDYKAACSDCEKSEVIPFSIWYPGINLLLMESATRLIYWDVPTKKFKQAYTYSQ